MSEPRTLARALADAAQSACGYTFVRGAEQTTLTYVDLARRACSVAAALTRSGLRRGDLVALVITDPEQFLIILFGASMAGILPASLYPPLSAADADAYLETTAGILRVSRARAAVASAALVDGLDRMRATCPALGLILSADDLCGAAAAGDADLKHHEAGLDDLAFVQFTSGSTSSPKGVALTHRNLGANVDAINGPGGLGTTDSDSAVSWLPLYHDMGLVGMALGPLYSARPGVFLAPQAFVKRPVEWLRAISQHRATVSFAPNFAYDLCVRRVKDRDLEGLDLSCWRVAGCGAEPIHAPTLRAFAERFAAVGFRESGFLPCYGLAEHVLAATLPPRARPLRVDDVRAGDLSEKRFASPAAADDPSTIQLVSCGVPLPGHRLRIVDADGHDVSEREVGEITLGGPSVMQGYYGDDELTRATIVDGWLRTGDLGYVSGGELYVCGRVKDLIIVNGRKYHPQDLEWSVDDLPGVRRGRVVAFGTTAARGGERVVIVVEPNGTAAAQALVDGIRRRIADRVGVYVDDVVLVSSGTVARTTSGKVQRAATRARYERGELEAERGVEA